MPIRCFFLFFSLCKNNRLGGNIFEEFRDASFEGTLSNKCIYRSVGSRRKREMESGDKKLERKIEIWFQYLRNWSGRSI